MVIAGLAGNICAATDAYIRRFQFLVASDCTASNSVELNDNALEQMVSQLKAKLVNGADMNFDQLRAESETTTL